METFGKLQFGGETKKVGSKIFYKVVCQCGTSGWKRKDHLVMGKTTSCGCFQREQSVARFTTHGYAAKGKIRTEYSTRESMIARCYNQKHKHYKNYGGRGIRVCQRWLDSFANFIADMGDRPQGLTLDRINNDGDYGPDNCRWATWKEQQANKRPMQKSTRQSASGGPVSAP